MRIALSGAAFATTVRVIHRVHRRAANGRADTAPALRTGFTELAQVVFGVADFADRRAAVGRHLAHFAGAKTQGGVRTFAGDELHRSAGTARELRALARLHLDAMHRRADRDIAQRQRVARLDRRIAAGHELVADIHALRRDDVAAFAVHVAQQRDMRSAVRVVFQTLDAAGDDFLVALEVDHAIGLLGTAALMTRGDAAIVV